MKSVFLSVALAFLATQAIAEECFRALIPDKIAFSRDTETNLSILQIVDESYYNAHQSDLSGDVLTAVFGVPVKASGSYQEFDEARSDIFSQYNYSYNFSESVSYASQTLSDNAVSAYRACLEANSKINPGFYAWLSYVDDELAVATLYWNPVGATQEMPTPIRLVAAIGGEAGSEFPSTFTQAEKRSVAFTRTEGEDLRLIIEGAGFGPYRLLAVRKPVITVPCQLQSENDTVNLSVLNGATHGLVCKTCPASSCEERSYHTFSDQTFDLACIKSIETTNVDLIKGFDCGWNPYGPKKQNMIYGITNSKVELGGADCSTLLGLAQELGVETSPGFCR